MKQSFSRCMEYHMLHQHQEQVQQRLMENIDAASHNVFFQVMLVPFWMMTLPMKDSFLSDEEGNITLALSQTSVTYKENLVRVFRRRKKIRRSLASLFNLGASGSWLSSTILSNTDSSHADDPWPVEASQSDSDFSSECNSHVPQRQTPASNRASLTKDDDFLQPEKPFCASKSCSPLMINANEETMSNAESRTVRNVLSQTVALITCLIISVCTRYFLGGLSATLLLIILVFLLSQDAAVSSFFSLDTSFKTTKFWVQEFNVSRQQQDHLADLLAFESSILEVRNNQAQLGEPYCSDSLMF
ncbi:transmembrane protein 71 [Mycteria americana]|uniref:transmembrane protein 71 n=1 Tax=Mycteria americana TaxID=33587 RepID=UPI003F586EE5